MGDRGRQARPSWPGFDLIFDVGLDDFIEGCFRRKAERTGAICFETGCPSGDDAHDRFIRLMADELDRLFTGNPAQGFDLFADRGT